MMNCCFHHLFRSPTKGIALDGIFTLDGPNRDYTVSCVVTPTCILCNSSTDLLKVIEPVKRKKQNKVVCKEHFPQLLHFLSKTSFHFLATEVRTTQYKINYKFTTEYSKDLCSQCICVNACLL